MPVFRRFAVGKDFTEQDYNKWLDQLIWWIGDRFPRIKDSRVHAEKIMKAALNGTKLNGSEWPGVSGDFFARVVQLSGFDVRRGIGIRDPRKITGRPRLVKIVSKEKQEIPPVDLKKGMELRENYIQDLLKKYPHLDSPVYKPKVEELAETIVKSRMISVDFIMARGKDLELLSKIRESLHKQISGLMSFLEIAPDRFRKQLDAKNTDVGSLIAKMESYGEVWEEYEKLDALRELLQKYHMLKATRPDGTPQLNDWELWAMTRNRPVKFTCRKCSETYTLLGGFTPEEIEQALIQANEVYGWGLEPIGTTPKTVENSIPVNIAAEGFAADEDLGESPETVDDDTKD